MLNNLTKLNPNIDFFSVKDEQFKKYGKVIDFDSKEIVSACEKIDKPIDGSKYQASISELENLNCSNDIKNLVAGGLDAQIGLCWGYNNQLNAMEYHKSSEINIAVTPIVLLLGNINDIEDGKLDSSKIKAFYLERGDVVEVYSTTLHFCPCQVQDDGFYCVVGLSKDTNTPLDSKSEDKMLWAKNKWLIAHENNQSLVNRGAYAGIYGENYIIKY